MGGMGGRGCRPIGPQDFLGEGGQGPNGSPPHGHNTLSFFTLFGFVGPPTFYYFLFLTPSELAHIGQHLIYFGVLIPFDLAHFT